MEKIKTFNEFINENHISPREVDDKLYNEFKESVLLLCKDFGDKEFTFKDIQDFFHVELNQIMLSFKKAIKK